jgi:hypothetical protein
MRALVLVLLAFFCAMSMCDRRIFRVILEPVGIYSIWVVNTLIYFSSVNAYKTQMRIYLKIIGTLYFIGFLLHVLDLFGARLNFVEMKTILKLWIVYLTVADAIAAYGLIKSKLFGEVVFLIVAFSQLVAYSIFTHIFGAQTPLIIFHLLTIGIYIFLLRKRDYQFSNSGI